MPVPHILVIGLPKGIQHPIDGFAKSIGLLVKRVYAELGNKGTLNLLPRPEHCLPEISAYLDTASQGADNYSGCHIVVLPYASVPPECLHELEVAAAMGAIVSYPDPAADSTWPQVPTRRKPAAHDFNRALTERLKQELRLFAPVREETLSEFIQQHAIECGVLLIADAALDSCDKTAPHRHEFIRNAVIAMTSAAIDGLHGRFEAYCGERGLLHAQNGRTAFVMSIYDGDDRIEQVKCETHLKQGDRTTREAAARVYYSFVDLEGVRYVALLHAGPHPDDGTFSSKVRLKRS